MKNYILIILSFLAAINCSQPQQIASNQNIKLNSIEKNTAEKKLYQENNQIIDGKILYKSFLNLDCQLDSTVDNPKEIFGEWEINFIGREPESFQINKVSQKDSLMLTSPLGLNEQEFYQAGFNEKINYPQYRIEKFKPNYKSTTLFNGFAMERNTVDFLSINKFRWIEIIDKNTLACSAPYGLRTFYIYHRKK